LEPAPDLVSVLAHLRLCKLYPVVDADDHRAILAPVELEGIPQLEGRRHERAGGAEGESPARTPSCRLVNQDGRPDHLRRIEAQRERPLTLR